MKMTGYYMLIFVTACFALSDGQLTEKKSKNVTLPACKWMRFNRSEVVFEGNSSEKISFPLGKLVGEFQAANVTGDGVTACLPLSPQLLQCAGQLTLAPMEDYAVLANGNLVKIFGQEPEIGVRDYYVVEGHYAFCSLRISDWMSRCSRDVYTEDEFRFEGPFNETLIVLASNKSIFRPSYTRLSHESIELCYPLDVELINCPNLVLSLARDFEIRADHKLYWLRRGCDKEYPALEPGEYLRDGVNVAHCAYEEEEAAFDSHIIQTAFRFVSAGSLFAAIVLHLCIPSLNYHAKPLMCHMTTMMVMYLCLGSRRWLKNPSPAACYTLFVFTYVSVVASFLWLNVLAFDLWLLFSKMNTTRRFRFKMLTELSTRKLFIIYNIYCWGAPILLSAYVITLDQVPEFQSFLGLYPQIHAFCWFTETRSSMVCLFGPMFGVIVINFILFIWTVKNLKSAGKGTEVVNKKVKKQLLFVCIRLFIVMGLCWFIEAITMPLCIGANVYYIPNSISSLQGLIIFIVYICKPNTFRLVRRKLTITSSNSSGTIKSSLTKSLSNGSGNGNGVAMKVFNLPLENSSFPNDDVKSVPNDKMI